MKKLRNKVNNGMVKVDVWMFRIKQKLAETSGADGSTEKTGWIIGALVIAGAVIFLLKKYVPQIGEMVMKKVTEFFNQATVS